MISFPAGQNTVVYNYNGLGDRISQTVNSVTTQFTLDLNTGLTQVLAGDDGSRYVYGRSPWWVQQSPAPALY